MDVSSIQPKNEYPVRVNVFGDSATEEPEPVSPDIVPVPPFASNATA
ncbi:unannotated protein [freshwater metagenome]|uniref:Unannotated protein n=1 Tax=freshwater metagenome TaxID=449393 RepID=A0A6J7SK33_9ZZZZ